MIIKKYMSGNSMFGTASLPAALKVSLSSTFLGNVVQLAVVVVVRVTNIRHDPESLPPAPDSYAT